MYFRACPTYAKKVDPQSLAINDTVVYSPCDDRGDDGIDRSNVQAATQLVFLFFLSALPALTTKDITIP
jgi:hypothetical protein